MVRNRQQSQKHIENSQRHQSTAWYAHWYITLLVIFGAMGIAAIFRVVLPWEHIMTDPIRFNTADAYYMLRFADMWPNMPIDDYIMFFPKGGSLLSLQLTFSYLIAIVANLFGVSTSQAAAVIPAVLGILTMPLIYFIGWFVFNNKVIAAISVLLASIMPGEFLVRSQLGAADYHCLEIFLLTAIMLTAIVAVKYLNRMLVFIPMAGLTVVLIAVYYYSWQGALISVFIIGLFVAIKLAFYSCHWAYKATVVMILAIGMAIALIWFHAPTTNLIGKALNIFTWHLESHTAEGMPLLFSLGTFGINVAWGYFGLTFYIGLIGLGMLICRYVAHRENTVLMLLVWTLVIVLMTFARRRFAYYYAVNVAILTSYACVTLVYVWTRIKHKKVITTDRFRMALLVIMLLVAIGVPITRTSVSNAVAEDNLIPFSWAGAMSWLKERANDQEYYSGQISNNSTMVLSWWDYGYWIVREGHTPALCTPGTGDRNLAAELLVNGDIERIKKLKLKYIIIDYQTVTTKLYSVISHAGKKVEDYYNLYQFQDQTVQLFYPSCYDMLLMKLYFFNGEQQHSSGTSVFTVDINGVVTDIKDIPTYAAAKSQVTNGSFIAGIEPSISPIDVSEIKGIKLAWQSLQQIAVGTKIYPEVKIFEVVP